MENTLHKENAITNYALVFICIIAAYMINRVLNSYFSTIVIKSLMGCAIIGVLLVWCYTKKDGKYNLSLAQSIIVIGCVMRIGYMLYTNCTERTYDLYEFSKDSYGHAAYLLNIVEEGRLPTGYFSQAYQQPFFYLCSSIVSQVVNGVLGTADAYYIVDAARVVSCFASCAILLLVKPFLDICKIKKSGACIALAIVAFTPAFYLAGGRVNGDALTTMFMLLEIMYTIKWYRESSWKNTVLLAIFYGLGVMTKISCGIFAIFTVCVFAFKLYRVCIKEKKVSIHNMCVKLGVFGLISIPLGLWYSIRNTILFGQPLMYVAEIPYNNPLYRGEYPILSRLFYFDWRSVMNSPYANPFEDYSAPVYYIKSSIFGEFEFSLPDIIARVFLFFAVLLALCTVIIIVRQFFVKSVRKINWIIIALCAMYYASMLWFYVKYPMGCSMDYRYMMILSVLVAILIGDYCEQKENRYYRVVEGVVMLYSVFSIYCYLWP